MTEAEALLKIADAILKLTDAITALGGMLALYLFLFLLFKKMG